MEDIRYKIAASITTGAPMATQRTANAAKNSAEAGPQFRDLLKERISENSRIEFSKHAIKRVADHGIDLTEEALARLNNGVRIAKEKNLDDTLILIDGTAFIVSTKNNTVITAANGAEGPGSVFTNIEGTVII